MKTVYLLACLIILIIISIRAFIKDLRENINIINNLEAIRNLKITSDGCKIVTVKSVPYDNISILADNTLLTFNTDHTGSIDVHLKINTTYKFMSLISKTSDGHRYSVIETILRDTNYIYLKDDRSEDD